MDTSMRLPTADLAALQSSRPASRVAANEAEQQSSVQDTRPGVEVSISEQGRAAAEQAARTESATVQPAQPGVPPASGEADPVTAPSATAAARAPESAAATPVVSQAPERVQSAQQQPAETRGVSNEQARAEREPDAPAAASSPSVQLYLDNANRPAAQAGPSTVRVSA